jgi:hypothetical protein
MRDAIFTLLALLALLVFLPVIILSARDRIRERLRGVSWEQRKAGQEAWRERMLHSRPHEVEASCGGLLPSRLLDMYSDSNLLLSRNFKVCAPGKDPRKNSWWIDNFIPLDVQGQQLTTDLSLLDSKGCCFAGDGMGNFYWVPVDSERKSDTPVFFACHDPWGNEKVADSLEEFLSWPRVAK